MGRSSHRSPSRRKGRDSSREKKHRPHSGRRSSKSYKKSAGGGGRRRRRSRSPSSASSRSSVSTAEGRRSHDHHHDHRHSQSRDHRHHHHHNNNGGGSGISAKVFVGNLDWKTSWKDLKDHMRQAGDVRHAEILLERDSGRSKGCGIVEYFSERDANHALRTLSGSTLGGREIYVQPSRAFDQPPAQPQGRHSRDDHRDRDRSRDGAGAGGRNNNKNDRRTGDDNRKKLRPVPADEHRLFVGNLTYNTTNEDLFEFFNKAGGKVVRASILRGVERRSKGCGIVEYPSEQDARRAMLDLNEKELNGRSVFIQKVRKHDKDAERHQGGGAAEDDNNGSGGGGEHNDNDDQSMHSRHSDNADNDGSDDDDMSRGSDRSRESFREEKKSERHDDDDNNNDRRRDGGDGCQIYVHNLAFETKWWHLKDFFRKCGDVHRTEVILGPDGKPKGCGTVKFWEARDAQEAIRRLNETELNGRKIYVKLDEKAKV